MELLPSKLKTFEYYINKLPLYLRNSFGMSEQFKCWYDILMNVNDASDEILNLLNIFDPDYLKYIDSLKTDINDNTDILNKLAALFGVARDLIITYKNEDDIPITETIHLSDRELLLLIKAQIIKNYFDGSREQINKLYELLGLDVHYITNETDYASCEIYLPYTSERVDEYTDNILKMFLAGLLNLESMGIEYSFTLIAMEQILIWDKATNDAYTGWDGGKWVL